MHENVWNVTFAHSCPFKLISYIKVQVLYCYSKFTIYYLESSSLMTLSFVVSITNANTKFVNYVVSKLLYNFINL